MGTFAPRTTLLNAPVKEPVSLDEVKAQLRLTGTDSDDELINLIQEGRRYAERHTGRAIMTQTWSLFIDDFAPLINIPYPPLQSVSAVYYNDLDDTQQTLDSSNYTVNDKVEPAQITLAYGGSYPAVYEDKNKVEIRFVAGYGSDVDDVPERFKRIIKLYIQWQYDQDEDAKKILDILVSEERVNWL